MSEEKTEEAVVPETANIIDELSTEFAALFDTPEETAEVVEESAEPAVETPTPVVEDVVEEKAEKAPTLLSPALAEKARREREARAEIEALKGNQEQAIADAKAALVQELIANPQAFIQKYQVENPGDLALHFHAADLGDEATPELRELIGQNDLERYKADTAAQIEQLRLEFIQRETNAHNQAVINQYEGFLGSVPTDLPYFASEATADSTEALRTMAQVADEMYALNGTYPSANEVATKIERSLEEIAARFAAVKPQSNVESTPQTVKPVEQSVTLSTDHSGKSAKKAPVGYDEHYDSALELLETMFPD